MRGREPPDRPIAPRRRRIRARLFPIRSAPCSLFAAGDGVELGLLPCLALWCTGAVSEVARGETARRGGLQKAWGRGLQKAWGGGRRPGRGSQAPLQDKKRPSLRLFSW